MPSTAAPETPLAAATHPNPYPFYATLVEERPLYRDGALRLWVASSARAVSAVLESDACHVRPKAEPVPAPLQASRAGFLFGQLVRMKDGPSHARLKRAVALALASLDEGHLGALASECAQRLGALTLEPLTPEGLDSFVLQLSVHVTASLLGLPRARFEAAASAVEDYVCAVGAQTKECLARGATGATTLLSLLGEGLDAPGGGGLLLRLRDEARRAGVEERDVVLANAVGFLTQAYESTAALIGNTLLALGTHPQLARSLRRAPALLGEVLAEVLRYDAPVQNTRRFVGHEADVAGVHLEEGDVLLVVLAAANRDPAANPLPHHFELARKARRTFTYGTGVHACPGQALSLAIAWGGVERLLRTRLDFGELLDSVRYRPSANVRLPRFAKRDTEKFGP